jgi:hypothetical protein
MLLMNKNKNKNKKKTALRHKKEMVKKMKMKMKVVVKKILQIKSDQKCLSVVARTKHDLYFTNDVKFFGCYWRNKSNNLCGFPTASNGLDYITYRNQAPKQSTFKKLDKSIDFTLTLTQHTMVRRKKQKETKDNKNDINLKNQITSIM